MSRHRLTWILIKQLVVALGVSCTLAPAAGADDRLLQGHLVVLNCRDASIHTIVHHPSDDTLLTARDCAKMGAPIAVVMGEGDTTVVYTLAVSSPVLVDYLSKPVRVYGQEIAPRTILPSEVNVEVDGRWIEVPTTTVM